MTQGAPSAPQKTYVNSRAASRTVVVDRQFDDWQMQIEPLCLAFFLRRLCVFAKFAQVPRACSFGLCAVFFKPPAL